MPGIALQTSYVVYLIPRLYETHFTDGKTDAEVCQETSSPR